MARARWPAFFAYDIGEKIPYERRNFSNLKKGISTNTCTMNDIINETRMMAVKSNP